MKELQPAQRLWEAQAKIENQSLTDRVMQLRQEVGEFFQHLPVDDASSLEKRPKYHAMEAVDIMIMCSSIVDALGFDVQALLFEKLHLNFRKYPGELITKFMDEGMTHTQAMARLKETWDDRKTADPKPLRRGW